ncbi:PRC-barrel domain-containing protein [Truepera radiovictrix]|uniref:PRC-barrel domain protein n=1 Tax=Truepera radiovictrix (strain DSM 17093 / CIP 108686 / LMG 22925 / RQ-24) TaxID=649638 RepID=D7CTD2_TRURR|nr:PRC-barrel domain-containing protein [Truepera radiovictrix]ADI13789.1 PRC-barrel domain protein [Truepera radiovictrix DSM 17093]WMT57645.1 PRC-barrel domain-containing protein [Truepera radiovictrix]
MTREGDAAPSGAGQGTTGHDPSNPHMATPEGRNLTAKTLIGDKVTNARGEDLGHLEDLMIDLETGTIAYAVLSYGGILGYGDKLFAVPWRALALDAKNKALRLEIEREVLKNAEGFDKRNWPNTADREWGRKLHDQFGVVPYWEEAP